MKAISIETKITISFLEIIKLGLKINSTSDIFEFVVKVISAAESYDNVKNIT
jgi:hypothetical protein